MYIKYIYQLHEMNRRLNNKIEAGHTLMLHARLLEVHLRFVSSSSSKRGGLDSSGILIEPSKKFIWSIYRRTQPLKRMINWRKNSIVILSNCSMMAM